VTENRLRVAIAVAAALGAAIAVYLLYERWIGGALVCSTGGCETVQHSRYAETFGIPVAALGFLSFAGLFAAAVARGPWARLVQATLATTAVVFSGYLLYLQVGVIHAICQWCVLSDALVTVIACLAFLRLRYGTPEPAAVVVPTPVRGTRARQYPKKRPNRRPTAKRH
jgi:uncharacterized membrane protein